MKIKQYQILYFYLAMKQKTSTPKTAKSFKKSSKFQINLKHKAKKQSDNTKSTLCSASMTDDKSSKRKFYDKLILKNHNRSQTTMVSINARSSFDSGNNLRLPLKQNRCSQIDQGHLSYRQYCMIEGKWIPLLTNTQRDKILKPVQISNENLQKKIRKTQPRYTTTPTESVEQTIQKLHAQVNQNNNLNLLSQQSKKHYAVILKNVMEKLKLQISNPKQKHQKLQKIQQKQIIAPQQQQQIEQLSSTVKTTSIKSEQNLEEIVSPIKNVQIQKLKISQTQNENIFTLIKMREYCQLTYIADQQNICPKTNQNKNQSVISTGMYSIHYYIQKLYETLQKQNLINQIVSNIKIAWGYPRKEKLSRLRNKKYLGSPSEVMPQFIFQLTQENIRNENMYQFIHNKCLFDCFNSELSKLKPFYDSNGQAFLWNFRFSTPLTFYDIGDDSLPYVFDEIQTKIMQHCHYLCGILVQADSESSQYELLMRRRMERQDIMARKQIEKEDFKISEQNAIQNQTTLSLINVSDIILANLIEELIEIINI